jgi:Type II restriction endonuclease EcoO109I
MRRSTPEGESEPFEPIRPGDVLRPRRFKRESLADDLPVPVRDEFVYETLEFLKRRYHSLAVDFDDISKTNFNPFLLLMTAPVYNVFSPFEVAERLQLGKAFHGDDTAFGRMGEERYLRPFGARRPPEKANKGSAWEPIDLEITVEGMRYLLSIKSGPWTMNQGHATAMIDRFPTIHRETGANIVLGILYGRYKNLNNKPGLVDRNIGHAEWFDFLVGRDFWEFITGIRDVHKHIFSAIRDAQRQFAAIHADETFHEKLVSNRLRIAASLRRQFDVTDEEDFWETLFNNMFEEGTL